MNAIEMLLAQPVFQAVGWALVHFVWQGALVAILFASLRVVLRRSTADVRYALACASLLLMLVLPVATILLLDPPSPSISGSALTVNAAGAILRPRQMTAGRSDQSSSLLRFTIASTAPPALLRWLALSERFAALLPWLVSVWLAGVTALSLRIFGGWVVTQRLKRYMTNPVAPEWQEAVARLSRRMRLSRTVRLCESVMAEVPTVIGWLRPVILLPVSALTGLSPRQMEALLAHELAHIRRHDYLVNLLQTAVETLLFYHPAVWWVSRQIRIEREHCCDDLAVAACGDVLTYARALTRLEELRLHGLPQLAVAANGGSLLRRIRRLVEAPPHSSHRSATWLAGMIAIAAVLGIWAGAQTTLHSEEAVASELRRLQLSSPIRAQAVARIGDPLNNHAACPLIIRDPQPVVVEVRADYDEGPAESEASRTLPQAETEDEDAQANQSPAPSPRPSPEPAGRSGDRPDFIDALAAAGYTNLSVDQLIEMEQHGVTPGFIKSLQDLGYQLPPIDLLIRVRDHGVGANFIKGLSAVGYGRLSFDDLIMAKDHGVCLDFIKGLEAAGYGRPAIDQLVRLKDHGVSLGFIKEIEAAGYPHPSIDQLIRVRDHGVSPAFIQGLKQLGYNDLPLEQLIRMRDHGVTSSFIQRVKSRGFNLSLEDLIRLRDSGILD